MKTDQPALFPDAVDESARKTYQTKDEIERAKEKRRRSKRKAWTAPEVPADGPHCIRCANWRAPIDRERFGSCRLLSVLEERLPHRSLEKGTVLTMGEANAYRAPVTALRTAAWATCSLFTQLEEDAA